MTVQELIQHLQNLDMPDADVRIASDWDASRPWVNSVWFDDNDGPVFIEIGHEREI